MCGNPVEARGSAGSVRVMEALAAAVRRGRHGAACDWKFVGASAGGGKDLEQEANGTAVEAGGTEQGFDTGREHGSAAGVMTGAMAAGGIANARLDLIPRTVSAVAAHRVWRACVT